MLGQSKFSLFTSRITRDRTAFERTRASVYGYPFFEMGENVGELRRKSISFHCLENESSELRESITEGAENYPDLPQISKSDVECSGGGDGESPEKKLVDLEVMPVVRSPQGVYEGIVLPILPNVVESVRDDSHDESQIIVSHLLGESLDVLDDSGLRQLIENVSLECSELY